MRIAFVCADPGVPVFGSKGCSIHVQAVVRELVRQGDQVHLFAARRGGDPPSDLKDLPCTFFELPTGLDTVQRERAAWELNRHLALALTAGPKFDWVYERYSLWGYAGMQHARQEDIPGILEVNSPLVEEQQRHRTLHDQQTAIDIARRVMRLASAVVCVSTSLKPYVEGLGAMRDRVHVIPNGCDIAMAVVPGSGIIATRDKKRFTIGFVGTLKPWHGLEDLGQAFSSLRAQGVPAELRIVGDGPAREDLRSAISPGDQEHVHWKGALPHAEVAEQLARMDVAVAPYPAYEPFYFSPLKIMEYMAAGLPVVASRMGDIPDWVRDGDTGLLYPPGNIPALVDCLSRMFADPERRRKMGMQGRLRVLEDGQWSHVVSRIRALAATPSSARVRQLA